MFLKNFVKVNAHLLFEALAWTDLKIAPVISFILSIYTYIKSFEKPMMLQINPNEIIATFGNLFANQVKVICWLEEFI